MQGEVLGSHQQRCGTIQALDERLLEVAAVRERVLLAQHSLPSPPPVSREKPDVLSGSCKRGKAHSSPWTGCSVTEALQAVA